LVNTKTRSLWLRNSPYDAIVQVYADADLGNEFSLKSISGYCILVNGNLISWGSKIQPTIAQSTLEAEYVALNLGTKEGLYVAHMLHDALNFGEIMQSDKKDTCEIPMEVYCDNARLVDSIKSGSIKGAKSVRHLRLKVGWLREQLLNDTVVFNHVAGVSNQADLFTKPLKTLLLEKFGKQLNIV